MVLFYFLNNIKFSLQTYFNIKLKYVSLFEQNNTTKCLKGIITKLTISGNWFAKKKNSEFLHVKTWGIVSNKIEKY